MSRAWLRARAYAPTIGLVAALAAMVSLNVAKTTAQRSHAVVVNVAGRQQALVERYASDVRSDAPGAAASAAHARMMLEANAAALLDGGEVTGLQGSDDESVRIPAATDRRARFKLEGQISLINKLVITGTRVQHTEMGSAERTEWLAELRLVAAEMSSVSKDVVGELTGEAQAEAAHHVIAQVIIGLLATGGAIASGYAMRRGGSHHQAARYRSLVAHSSDLTLVVDQDSAIGYASPSAQPILGLAPAELVSRQFDGIVHPDDAAAVVRALQESGRVGASAVESQCRLRSGDGQWRHFDLTFTDATADPAIAGTVVNAHDITARYQLEQQLTDRAFHDSLTGLANRALLRDRIEQSLGRAKRLNQDLALLFLDLDGFKVVNDTAGHEAGDALLCEIGRRITSTVRDIDTVARLGGDEFAVLLEGIADRDYATGAAQRILDAIRMPVHLEGKQLTVGASIGLVFSRGEHPSNVEVLRDADVAMYVSKGSGRDRYTVFEPDMYDRLNEQHQMLDDLRHAVAGGQIQVVYQPIVASDTTQTRAVEALARWHHPSKGVIAPMVFIPLAEQSGLIGAIGSHVLRTACNQLAQWDRENPASGAMSMSVNLSARQLGDTALVSVVRTALADAGIEPHRLTLEITESTLMHDVDVALAQLNELKALGVRLAIDDFGTGYSSLAYLRRFPIDELKIDRSFLQELHQSPLEAAAIIRSISDLGATLGLHVVAEGIEDQAQLSEARKAGCDLVQGYLFSRPVSAEQISASLAEAHAKLAAATAATAVAGVAAVAAVTR